MANTFRWTFYVDSQERWRWKRKASACKAVAYSEGFQSKVECIDNAKCFGYVVKEEEVPLSNDPFSDVRRPEPD